MIDYDLRDNYFALLISIMNDWTAEQSFRYLESFKRPPEKKASTCRAYEMLKMREAGIACAEIAAKYGVSVQTVYKQIHRARTAQLRPWEGMYAEQIS